MKDATRKNLIPDSCSSAHGSRNSKHRAVALFSGGLDSMLAIRIMQLQGFEVEALNIRTIYSCCKTPAAQAAIDLGARLTVLSVDDDYLDLLRNPRYGFGRGANPCIDCRIYMCRMAKRFMQEVGACVVVTGEIAGQRPMSQKKSQLHAIDRHSGLDGRLLRPLSAKLLPQTRVELEGVVDRDKLHAFHGRGRGKLIELAHELGLSEMPSPSTGCALTERSFAPRVHDLLQYRCDAARWEFELLNYGRHIRLNERTKIVVGRNASENAVLRSFASRDDASGEDGAETALVSPEGFAGPDALAVGCVSPAALRFASELVLRYAGLHPVSSRNVHITHRHNQQVVSVTCSEAAHSAATL
ncbi:MAG: hypothetical protein V3R99_05065 [Thermoguttaceae bacterium]